MQISVSTNFADVAKQITELHADVAAKASARAINATIAQAKTLMSREIRKEYVLSAAKVNDALRVNKAFAKDGLFNLEASLESPSKKGRSLNLINFAARQTDKGVSFKIRRDGGRKLIKGAFISTINGGTAVFKRVGKERFPIVPKQSIGVSQMFNQRRINKLVLDAINERFPVIFAREAKFYTDKFNAARAATPL